MTRPSELRITMTDEKDGQPASAEVANGSGNNSARSSLSESSLPREIPALKEKTNSHENNPSPPNEKAGENPVRTSARPRIKVSATTTLEASVFRSEPFMADVEEVIFDLATSEETGLTDEEAARRLVKYGANELETVRPPTSFVIFMRQLLNAMIVVLIAAMIVVFSIKDWIEAGVIVAVIAVNVLVGFFQEKKAQKHMNSLQSLSSPTARVVRAGIIKEIDAGKVVPGDIVILLMGDTVPADLRLIEAVALETDESMLTGESLPVSKNPNAIFDKTDTPVGDRLNLAFSSSNVTKGRGKGVAIYTGMYTQIGAIATSMRGGSDYNHWKRPRRRKDGSVPLWAYPWAFIQSILSLIGAFLGVNVGTPLHRKLASLAVVLFFLALVCAFIVFAANKFSGAEPVVIYAVATAISIIPSSLLAVLTICMAAGAKAMLKRNVIVRKMASLEALGAVTDICSDKTGTLTQGKMVVRKAWLPNYAIISVAQNNDPFNPTTGGVALEYEKGTSKLLSKPHTLLEKQTDNPEELIDDFLEDFLRILAMANIARVKYNDKTQEWSAVGDPTECALQVFVYRFNRSRDFYVENGWKQLVEYPFDSEVKRMSVLYKNETTGETFAFMKGAVERVFSSCSSIALGSEIVQITDEIEEAILADMKAIASQGLRCLAFASKKWTKEIDESDPPDRKEVENDLIFRGMTGIFDPPRPESAPAVQDAKNAGIAVHMLTGDHRETAESIAKDIGIIPRDTSSMSSELYEKLVMTATEFDKMTESEIDDLKFLPAVIARCAPQTKVRMIEALHRRKRFAAMTGDGVNDSPSLKRSDIGIAMGKNGSDVAKDASDIVLTDDNFASIMNAVEEGRRMFDNIQKFILLLVGGNIAQGLYLLIGLAFRDSSGFSVFPISPIEILWNIMVCASFPAMGLGFEKAAPNCLKRPPHNIRKGVFTNEVILDMFVYGLIIAALSLVSFVIVVWGYHDGNLGAFCNEEHSDSCKWVFRGRSTGFSLLTVLLIILPWILIDLRRSTFWRHDVRYNGPKIFEIFYTIWRNQFMFWSIVGGFLTLFPVIYIPVINRKVFKHDPISWEWAIVAIATLVFIIITELYKWLKRYLIRRFNLDPPPMSLGNWWEYEKTRSTGTLSFRKFASLALSERSFLSRSKKVDKNREGATSRRDSTWSRISAQ